MNDEAKEEKAEAAIDPLHEARERYTRAKDAWSDDRKRYIDDVKFAAGEQWPEKIRSEREGDSRPVLVVDKCGQYIRQVVNDSRQSRPAIKVRPVDSAADVDTAEIIQGICRHIEDRSNADVAYDTALECAVKGGFGFFRILTEYAHDSTFEQEICIKRIRNPLTVLFDPDCMEPDGSDARYAFVTEDMDKDVYELTYGDVDAINWDDDSAKYGDFISEDKVKICEYFYVEESEQNLNLFTDGTTATDEEIKQATEAGIPIPEIKETRAIPIKKVMWCKMNGKGYLEEPKEWPGKYIPVIPVWGNEEDIDGEVRHTGMIHSAKDAARLYNYSRSAYAERVALTPKAPYVAAFGQVEDFPEWEDANNRNYSVLRYNPIDAAGNAVPPPQRQPAFDVPAGFAQDMQIAEHDIQSALGMYAASVGQPSNEKSGRAIIARERSGDMATFHYHDNLARAIRHGGRIIVDMVPRVYDTARVVRILGIDGTADMVQLNPALPQSTVKLGAKSIHNIGLGKYDVSVSTGPSYTTRRQEAAESMVQLVQGNPALMQIMGDLLVKNMDWPGAEEIADRLRLMLPPQIQQAAQSDKAQSPEVMQVMAQAKQAIAQRDQQLQQAQVMMQQMNAKLQELMQNQQEKAVDLQIKGKELSLKEQETAIKARDTEIKAYEAETERMQALAPAFNQSEVQQLVIQTLTDLMQPNAPPEQQFEEMPPQGGFFSPEEMANVAPQETEQ